MIVIKFGLDNELRKDVAEFPSVGAILRNPTLQAALGFGDNIQAHVNESEVPDTYALRDGDLVELTTRANSKG